ncbi:MAG: diacylglycerol/lipid kinase family protein [Anaerolineae bacterium]
MRTKLIANPNADRGRGAAALPQITDSLRKLGVAFDLDQTEAPAHAVELARRAVAAGYERIVAVGGDGTCNEVVNGLFTAVEPGATPCFGVIPAGSGNDFAHALNIPPDPERACAVLRHGGPRPVDLGKVIVDGQSRYFANNVGLGFDGEVAVDQQTVRRLHGFLMYLWSVFRVLAVGRWPYDMTTHWNNTQRDRPVTLITVANGVRSGGGFLLTPAAQLDDGLLDICCAGKLSRLGVLKLLPKTFDGSHVYDRAITMAAAPTVRVSVAAGVPAHIDGEILCRQGRQFEFEALPGALTVWA